MRNPPAVQETQETQVGYLGEEGAQETAAHSRVLAGRVPWTEEPGGLQALVFQSQTQLSTHGTKAIQLGKTVLSTNGSGKIVNPHTKNGESTHF